MARSQHWLEDPNPKQFGDRVVVAGVNPHPGGCSRISLDFPPNADGVPACGQPVTHHVVWDFTSASGVCAEHAAELQDDALAVHPYDHDVCPLQEAEFDADNNRCIRPRVTSDVDRTLAHQPHPEPIDDLDWDNQCPGHYDDDATLMSGVGIGEPSYCDGSCQS